MRRLLLFMVIVFTLSACASSPPQAQRSEFEDIPVPKGLVLDWSRSTIIESPTIKAARLFYKGRLTPDSLAVAFRTTLETNGWRYLSSTTAAEKGIFGSATATRLWQRQPAATKPALTPRSRPSWMELIILISQSGLKQTNAFTSSEN